MTEILGEHCRQQPDSEVAEWLWATGVKVEGSWYPENSYFLSSYGLVFCLFVLLYTALWICLRINYSKYLFSSKKFYWDVIHTLYNSIFKMQPNGFWYITIFLKIVLMKLFTSDRNLSPCAGTWNLRLGLNLCSSNWDCRPGFRTWWSLGSWCFISDSWCFISEFSERQNDRLEVDIFKEKHASTDRVWAIREGEWDRKRWHG